MKRLSVSFACCFFVFLIQKWICLYSEWNVHLILVMIHTHTLKKRLFRVGKYIVGRRFVSSDSVSSSSSSSSLLPSVCAELDADISVSNLIK